MNLFRNDFLRRAAAFFWVFLFLVNPVAVNCNRTAKGPQSRIAAHATASRRRPRRIMCHSEAETSSFWLRNACFDGYLTVHNRKVVAQHQGLHQHSPQVEIVKETCQDFSRSHQRPFGLVLVRLFNPKSQRYICFNRRGKVKSMTKRRAEKLGRLCAFYELPAKSKFSKNDDDFDPSLYVNLRSAHNTSWYLGFNGRRKRISYTSLGQAVSLPRPMFKSNSKRARKFHPKRCDFLFSTGQYSAVSQKDEWRGLFDHILLQQHQNEISSEDNKEEEAAAAQEEKEEFSQNLDQSLEHVHNSRLLEEVVETVENDIESLKTTLREKFAASTVPEQSHNSYPSSRKWRTVQSKFSFKQTKRKRRDIY